MAQLLLVSTKYIYLSEIYNKNVGATSLFFAPVSVSGKTFGVSQCLWDPGRILACAVGWTEGAPCRPPPGATAPSGWCRTEAVDEYRGGPPDGFAPGPAISHTYTPRPLAPNEEDLAQTEGATKTYSSALKGFNWRMRVQGVG